MHQVELNENEPIWQAEISLRYFIFYFILFQETDFLTTLTTPEEHVLHVQNMSLWTVRFFYGDNSRNGAEISLKPSCSLDSNAIFSTSIWICMDVNTYWVIDKKKTHFERKLKQVSPKF